MGIVSLVIVANEVEELKLGAVLGSNAPIEKRTEGVLLHNAVEQPTNLPGPPYKFTLDRRQHQVVPLNLIKRPLDGVSRLIHAILLVQESSC